MNYRKQASPSMQDLLPETEFRLYGVCARFPQGLARDAGLEELQQGVYLCRRGTDHIRIIVTSQIPEEEHNAPLHLFSASPERVRFGAAHYRQHSPNTSTLLYSLFDYYQVEGVPMPYTMEDFKRDYFREFLDNILKEVPHEELLKRIPPEERLQGLSLEERLKGLSDEEIEAYLRRLKGSEKSPPPENDEN